MVAERDIHSYVARRRRKYDTSRYCWTCTVNEVSDVLRHRRVL